MAQPRGYLYSLLVEHHPGFLPTEWPAGALDGNSLNSSLKNLPNIDDKSFVRTYFVEGTHKEYDVVDLAFMNDALEQINTSDLRNIAAIKEDMSSNSKKEGFFEDHIVKHLIKATNSDKYGLYYEFYKTNKAHPAALSFFENLQGALASAYDEKNQSRFFRKYYNISKMNNNAAGYVGANADAELPQGVEKLLDLNDIQLDNFYTDVSKLVNEMMGGNFSTVTTEKRKVKALDGQEIEFGTFLPLSEQSKWLSENGYNDLALRSIEMDSFSSINMYTTVGEAKGLLLSDNKEIRDAQGISEGKAQELKKLGEEGYLTNSQGKLILVNQIDKVSNSITRSFKDKSKIQNAAFSGHLPERYKSNLEAAGIHIYSDDKPDVPYKQFDTSGYSIEQDLSSMKTLEQAFSNIIEPLSDKMTRYSGRGTATGGSPKQFAIDSLGIVSWDTGTYALKMQNAWINFVKKTATDKKAGTPKSYISLLGLNSTTIQGFDTVPITDKDSLKQIYLYARDITAYEIFVDIANRVESARTILVFAKMMSNLDDDQPSADGKAIANEIEQSMQQGVSDIGAGGTNIGSGEADTEPLTEKQIKDRQKFFKQCVLLLNMPRKLRMYYRMLINKASPDRYSAAVPDFTKTNIHSEGIFNRRLFMAGTGGRSKADKTRLGNTKDIINMLVTPSAEAIKPFLNITPDIVSALVPKIRLFKVYTNRNGGLSETEFVFENFENPNRIQSLRNASYDKGNGAGIKGMTFSFEGSTPATSRNDIVATLKLHFQTFNDFIRVRTSPSKKGTWSFSDLVIFPGAKEGEIDTRSYDPSNYRIRVDVGWQLPQYAKFKTVLNPRRKAMGISGKASLQEALKRMNKSFYLNMVDHEFDIRPDGTVDMTFSYRAYIESMLKSPSMDALWTPDIQLLRDDAKKLEREFEQKVRTKKCTPNELRQLKAALVARDLTSKKDAYRSIMQRLLDRNLIHQTDVKASAAREFQKLGTFSVRPELDKITSNSSLKKPTDLDNSENRINFFFMGDLVHTILDCLYKDDGKTFRRGIEKTKVILTQFDYELYIDQETTTHTSNIADIPISVDFFFEWFTQHVIKPRRESYPVLSFIRDLTNDLIVEALLEVCVARNSNKKILFQTSNFMGVGEGYKGSKDPLSDLVNKYSTKPARGSVSKTEINVPRVYKKGLLPLKNDDYGIVPVDDYYNYLVVFPVMSSLLYNGTGNYKSDGFSGVYHLNIGADRGLVKSIKFTKSDMAYVREARFMRNGFDGRMQLGAVYKVTIEMIGNTIFYPGMTVWIDPVGIGDNSADWDPRNGPQNNREASIANALGFGGYHTVTRVENNITAGSFTTTVTAQFEYSGDGSKNRTVDTKKRPGDKNRKFNKSESSLEKRQITTTKCTQIIKEIEDQVAGGEKYVAKLQRLQDEKIIVQAVDTIQQKRETDDEIRAVKVDASSKTTLENQVELDNVQSQKDGEGIFVSDNKNNSEIVQVTGDLEIYSDSAEQPEKYVEIFVPSQATVLTGEISGLGGDPLDAYGGTVTIEEKDFLQSTVGYTRVGPVAMRQQIGEYPIGKDASDNTITVKVHKFMTYDGTFLFNGIQYDPITALKVTDFMLAEENARLQIMFYNFVDEPAAGATQPVSVFDI